MWHAYLSAAPLDSPCQAGFTCLKDHSSHALTTHYTATRSVTVLVLFLVPMTLSMWYAQTAATCQHSLQGPDWKDIPSEQKLLASNRPSSADGAPESNFLWRPDAAECAMDSKDRAESSRYSSGHLPQLLACRTVVISRHSSYKHASATRFSWTSGICLVAAVLVYLCHCIAVCSKWGTIVLATAAVHLFVTGAFVISCPLNN